MKSRGAIGRMRPLSFCALLAVGLFLASPATAQDATRLVEQGIDLREQRRDDEALALFERAYAMEDSPRTLAQIGLAEQALSQYLEAEGHLVAALASRDDWIARNRAPLEQSLAEVRTRLARLDVRGTPQGELYVDGVRVASVPLASPIPRMPGTVTVEVRAEGYENATETVELRAGEVSRVQLTLSPGVAAPVAAPPGTELPLGPILLMAGGGAVAIVGAVMLGVAFAEKGALENPAIPGVPWGSAEQAAAERVPLVAGAGEILLAAGLAAAAGGVVWLLLDEEGSETRVGLGPSTIELRGRF